MAGERWQAPVWLEATHSDTVKWAASLLFPPASGFLLQEDGLEFSHTEFTLGLPNGRTLTPGTGHQLVLDE